MNKPLQYLSQPGRIGAMSLKNRMLVTAMGANLGEEDASCGDRIIAYHERQARGGAALIITGVASVGWPHGAPMPRPIGLSDDRFLPGLRALVDAVHKHDCRIAAQLHHGGINAVQDTREGRPLWVPSHPADTGPSDLAQGMLPEELRAFAGAGRPRLHVVSKQDLQQAIAWFAAGAERAKRAGFDAAEIHAGHGYILSGFLSPAMNRRDDEYGGSLENRARLLLEVIAAVRDSVGKDFPLWVKLDCAEYGKRDGIRLSDAIATAALVEAAGVDAITASAYHDTTRGFLHSESNIPFVPEKMVSDATAIKSAVSVPVITSGRIEPEAADRHIREGHFDFLAMGRKILADPDLPQKLLSGRPETIRPCVYCYCCASQIYKVESLKCAVNPETAYERERALIATDRPRRIGVVGGGPAGMEAARRLALRGFDVTLLEAGPRLGGTLSFASIAYAPNERLLRWLRREIAVAKVTVQLNTLATPERLRQLGLEEVIVATGARRGLPAIPGCDHAFVFSGDEMRALVTGDALLSLSRKVSWPIRIALKLGALTGITSRPALVRHLSHLWMPISRKVTIIGAELVGLELAEFLAERGRQVTVLDSGEGIGRGLYIVRRLRLLQELRDMGVALLRETSDIVIEEGRVDFRDADGNSCSIETDQVIIAQGAEADMGVADSLRAAGFTVHSIGDCTGVGYIEGAMEAAAELAARL